MLRINSDELDLSYDAQVYLYKGNPFTGVAFEEDSTGYIMDETAYVNGLMEGPSRSYYPSGHLRLEEELRGSVVHGRSKSWYENGQCAWEKVHEYGILIEEWRWDEGGALIKHFRLAESDTMHTTLQLMPRAFLLGKDGRRSTS